MNSIRALLLTIVIGCSTNMQSVMSSQLPITVLICSYNNSKWIKENLDSVFSQDYDNFRVMYIDDCSSDGTPDIVKDYIEAHNLHDKITIITNEQRYRKMRNMYLAVHLCDDEEIIVQLDGDDWFAHNKLLSEINELYQNPDVWITYGSYENFPSGERGRAREVASGVVKDRSFRTAAWVYMPTRTFYAWLFKQVKLQDYIAKNINGFKGKFYPAHNDGAIMYPMLEMAGSRYKYVDEIGYIANRGNPISGGKVDSTIQNNSRRELRKCPKYPLVTEPSIDRLQKFADNKADLVVLSDNNPDGLSRYLDSIKSNVQGIAQTIVLYGADTLAIENQYRRIKSSSDIVLMSVPVEGVQTIAQTIAAVLQQCNSHHVILANDTIFVQDAIDITKSITMLERTFGHAVYFALGHDKEPFYTQESNQQSVVDEYLWNEYYTWLFSRDEHSAYNNIDMTLFRKTDIANRVSGIPGNSLREFNDLWHKNKTINVKMIGLHLDRCRLDY